MIENIEVLPDDLLVSNSSLGDFYACETRGAMAHVLGLTVGEDAIELAAGQAVHEVLARWAGGQPDEASLTSLRPYEAWAKEHMPADDDRLSGRNVRRITAHWLKHNPLRTWKFVVKPEEIEVTLMHPLGEVKGRRVVMVAVLDLIGKMRTGGRWSVDHKTTKQVNNWFEDDQDTSSQFTGQLWLARAKGIMLSGVYINAVEYPKLPGSDKKCSAHGGVPYVECQLKHTNPKLFPVTRTPHEIAMWEKTALKAARTYIRLLGSVKTIQDVHDNVVMDGRFKRQCRRCEFREWCRAGRPVGALKTFKKRKLSPVKEAQLKAKPKEVEGEE